MTKVNQNFELWAGEDKVLSCSVLNSAGAAQSIVGATISWSLYTGPNAATATLTVAGVITNAAGGLYTVTLTDTQTAALVGTYYHKATLTDATSNVTVIMEGWATFNPSKNYATLGQLKERLGILSTDTGDDSVLIAVLAAVSRFVDDHCGRRFYTTPTDETRYYTAQRAEELLTDDIVSLTTVQTDDDGDRTYESTWAATDYDLWPYNAALDGKPYMSLRPAPDGDYSLPVGVPRGVKLTGKFGWGAAAPWPVQEATLIQATRIHRRKDAPFGVTGVSDMGQSLVISRLDPDVRTMLAPYRKMEFV